MSDPTTDARVLPVSAASLRWERLTPMAMALAGVVAIVALAAADAALRGPWLDEFWTLELADDRNGLWALVRDGWLHDAHPPIFNAWATLLGALGLTSIPAGRLASSVAAVAFVLWAALRLSRRSAGTAHFAAALLLLTLALPQAMESFAVYRSYFWQMAAIAVLTLVARHVASAAVDLDWRRDADLVTIAVTATVAAIGLHYVCALFGGLLAAAIALCALTRGLRRWAVLMLATAALASLLLVACLLLQAPNWMAEFDHSWIDTSSLEAFGVVASLVAAPLWVNPVPLAGLWRARARAGAWSGPGHQRRETWFVGLIGGVLAAGIAAVLAVHAVVPVVVDRYLFAVPVLVGALLAVPAARLARDRWLFGLLAVTAIAGAARPMLETGIRPLWSENARTIAGIVAGCPATRVYAASGWALGPASATRAARREDPVFERAYRTLAAPWGFAVHFVGQNETAHAAPGACPVLLWYEHSPNEAEDDLPAAIECAGLDGLQDARLSMTRSATGFVVRADRR